ncbi:uncharacterized protein LOC143788300 [Ranitomeya variabilis]|uniref:uncharacterized protein LOC143788300 n=1 Tax=Ranitomeya variabilis TaxID=490064 RepID=UPI0040572678
MQKFGWVVDLGNQVIWKDSNGCKPVVIDPSDYSHVGSICLNDVVSTDHLWPETGGDEVLTEIVQLFPSLWAQFRNEVGTMKDVIVNVEGRDPPPQRQYKLPPESIESMSKIIQELLKQGVIRKANSVSNNPLWCVLKSDGSYRMILDLRMFNKHTPNVAPIVADTHDMMARLNAKAKYFSVLDISNGFFSIPLEKSCQYKFAFTFLDEQYLFCRLPQGAHLSPSIFHQALAKEEMNSNKSWNTEHHDLDGRDSTPILREKTTVPRKSYYLMGIAFLLLCTISTVIYAEDILHRETDTSEVNEPFRRTLHSRKPRGSSLQNLKDEDIPDNSVDITGNICMGYGVKCCIELHFIHDTDIILHATTRPKAGFIQLQGDSMSITSH